MMRLILTYVIIVSACISTNDAISHRRYSLEYYQKSAETLHRHRVFLDENDDLVIPTALKEIGLRPTFIYVHGYFSIPSIQHQNAEMYFANKRDADTCCHFFVLDWTAGACWTEYHSAMSRTRTVAETGVNILKQLIAARLVSLDGLTIVGHSLGAHVSGIIATLFWLEHQAIVTKPHRGDFVEIYPGHSENIAQDTSAGIEASSNEKSTTEIEMSSRGDITEKPSIVNTSHGLVAVLVALDPAGPGYRDIEDNTGLVRLHNGRAVYTLVIHTNSFYGLTDPVGDADFYPNGGRYQWNCIQRATPNIFQRIGRCSHRSAPVLYWNSLNTSSNALKFFAIRCDDHALLLHERQRKCEQKFPDNRRYEMAGDVLNSVDRPHGVFYLETDGFHYDIHPVAVDKFAYGLREHEAEERKASSWRSLWSSVTSYMQTIF